MGLPYPGGISIDKISKKGRSSAFAFPHPRVDGAPYDFSFSGLKTSVINTVHNAQQKGVEINIPDLAASFQKSVVDCLISNLRLASENFGYNKIVLAGGVSANSLLREQAQILCSEKRLKLYLPELKYCGDNGAMVASQGYYEYLAGTIAGASLNAYATMPVTDSITDN